MKGVIEGFYGRPWSWQARADYAPFLAAIDYDTYIYAPKADALLRKHWRQAWPHEHTTQLQQLSRHFAQHHINFGVGLSPLGLIDDFSFSQSKADVSTAISRLLDLGVQQFCLLFDDMPGQDAALAQKQLAIADFIEAKLPVSVRLALCPSYYSSDPVLDEVFGQRPEHYLADLGAGLSSRWDIFWTGQNVVTADYDLAELQQLATVLQRQPLLWDNYPVNDGKALWPYLNLAAKPRLHLQPLVAGYVHNPMNQAYCSMLSIARMAQYEPLQQLLNIPNALWHCVLKYQDDFQQQGLNGMTTQLQKHLLQCVAFESHAMGAEIRAWLSREYAFDPACLT